MTSEKRRLANQQNAQKSTGPKTAAGKTRSRRNALKHGLSGNGVVLRRADEQKMSKRIADWRATLAPITPVEAALVERAALATLKLESAVRQEGADRRHRIGKAVSRLKARERKEVAAIVATLPTEPWRALRRLKALHAGQCWLDARWEDLGQKLQAQGCWDRAELDLALQLLGRDPTAPYPSDALVLTVREAFLAALSVLDLEQAQALLNPQGEPLSAEDLRARLPDRAEAQAVLARLVESERSELAHGLADDRQAEARRVARAEAIDRAQIDTSCQAYRLHRYEINTEMSLHRNLNELIKIRKQEPELASIARWEKQGKIYNRRWDGYSWVPNAEWRSPDTDEGAGEASHGDAEEAGEARRTGEESSSVSGAETESMTRMPASEAVEPRAGVSSHDQPLPWVAGVERSDRPDCVVRSEQASTQSPDQGPAAVERSAVSRSSRRSDRASRFGVRPRPGTKSPEEKVREIQAWLRSRRVSPPQAPAPNQASPAQPAAAAGAETKPMTEDDRHRAEQSSPVSPPSSAIRHPPPSTQPALDRRNEPNDLDVNPLGTQSSGPPAVCPPDRNPTTCGGCARSLQGVADAVPSASPAITPLAPAPQPERARVDRLGTPRLQDLCERPSLSASPKQEPHCHGQG